MSLPNCKTLQGKDDLDELLFNGNIIIFLPERVLAIKVITELNSEPRETTVEMSVQGPQMGLCEDLATNITLIRRRYPSKNLVMEKQKVGTPSKTDIVLLYGTDYVQEDVLAELKTRLSEIEEDMIQAGGQLQNALTKGKFNLFPTMMITERPDHIVLNISQGKIAILINGTPFSLIAPTVFFDFISAMDDLYQAYWIKNLLVVLRYIDIMVTLTLPASYIAISSFKPEIVWSQLAMTIAGSRSGVDKSSNEKKPYSVTLKLDIPSAQIQPGKTNFQLLTERADSIHEAIRVMESKVDKQFDFGHCRVILFSKAILNEDQKVLLDWFMRRRDIQGISFLGVGKPSAKAVLKIKAKSERLPSNALVLAFDESVNTSPYVITEILNDYFMRLYEDGIDAFLPVIEPLKDTYKIDTCAIMKGTTYKGELNRDETRILNELENTPRRGHISVATKHANFFIFVDKLKSKMKIKYLKGKKPYVEVNVKVIGTIEEAQKKFRSSRDLKEYANIAEHFMNKQGEAFFKHLQRMGVDPFGLGLKYEAKNGVTKRVRENWKRLYPEIDILVHTHIDLRGSGTMY
ncbi:MAG: Ger(x)C family spore germination protein [Bacillota bacterium]|nr:Ger(x)C family spore germination protein [Bacillota bacterium]